MPHYSSLLKLLLPVFIVGCSSKSDKENIILREMISSVEASSINLDKSSQTSLKSLEEKLYDPATMERAIIWNARALEVSAITREVYNYIVKIKSELKSESTKGNENPEKFFDPTNKKAVSKVLFDDKKGEEVIIKMINHKENLFKVDSNIRLAFQDSYPFPVEQSVDYYFKGSTVLESVAFLTSMQNNIKVIENRIIAFCNNKSMAGCILTFDTYSAIIGQSSNIIKPGDEIVISAGVGAFGKAAVPKILMNNKEVEINDRAVAILKLKAPKIPGIYKVPVKINYIDEDGQKQIIEEVIEYTVSDCKN